MHIHKNIFYLHNSNNKVNNNSHLFMYINKQVLIPNQAHYDE